MNFTPVIIIEVFLTISLSLALRYCDKRVIELHKKILQEGDKIIEGIREINRELVKVNYILEKINKIRKVNWLKIIIKVLDLINVIMILAPIGKKTSFIKRLFSIKSIRSLLKLKA